MRDTTCEGQCQKPSCSDSDGQSKKEKINSITTKESVKNVARAFYHCVSKGPRYKVPTRGFMGLIVLSYIFKGKAVDLDNDTLG